MKMHAFEELKDQDLPCTTQKHAFGVAELDTSTQVVLIVIDPTPSLELGV